ncbi:DNA-binding response regulator [Erwinia sp. CPCC 100877]|nr:DNA-binding response regulator [Erwinia sp. CPCC 100877]
MCTIGYISLSNKIKDKHKQTLDVLQCKIKVLGTDNLMFVLNNEIKSNRLNTVIIEDSGVENINWTCEVIMKFRKYSEIPLWILPVNDINNTNRIVYLQLGADGIIGYGGNLDESLLMIRNMMKRFRISPKEAKTTPEMISENANFQLIPQNLSVRVDDNKEVLLTKLEFLTIEYLHKHARTTKTYKEIYENVWNDSYQNKKYRVSNLVFHLRQKIESNIEKPKYIITVRSRGYMLNI